VLTWSEADQEKVARFVREVEQWRTGDGLTEDEWVMIEERAARYDLATDAEVEKLFSRYRQARSFAMNAALSPTSMRFLPT